MGKWGLLLGIFWGKDIRGAVLFPLQMRRVTRNRNTVFSFQFSVERIIIINKYHIIKKKRILEIPPTKVNFDI